VPRRKPVCPAATTVGDPSRPSVVCGVLDRSNDGAQLNGLTERGQVTPLFDGRRDANTVTLLCCGSDGAGGRCYYTECVLWRAAKETDWAGRSGPDALRDPQAGLAAARAA